MSEDLEVDVICVDRGRSKVLLDHEKGKRNHKARMCPVCFRNSRGGQYAQSDAVTEGRHRQGREVRGADHRTPRGFVDSVQGISEWDSDSHLDGKKSHLYF